MNIFNDSHTEINLDFIVYVEPNPEKDAVEEQIPVSKVSIQEPEDYYAFLETFYGWMFLDEAILNEQCLPTEYEVSNEILFSSNRYGLEKCSSHLRFKDGRLIDVEKIDTEKLEENKISAKRCLQRKRWIIELNGAYFYNYEEVVSELWEIVENHRISSYIDSNAIRDHLRAIQYEFSPLEAAWLIWQCQHLTLQEKHNEWKEIIDQTPDMKFRTCGGTSPEMDLHDFLTRYMEIDNIWMDRFMRPEQDIYRYSLRLTAQDGTFSYVDSDCFFSSYEFCLEAARKDAAEYDEQECRNLRIRIIKKKINDTKEISGYMELCLNSHFEILEIDDLGYAKDDEEDNVHIIFEEMWFSFPVPFQKGDILYNTTRSYDHFCAGPMVLTVAAPEHYNKKGRKGNDLSDMWIAGYFQDNEDGTVYAENDYNYMEYDYCPPEQLTGKKRLLLALSNYLKDKISIDLFMEACAQIIGEEYVQDHFKRLSSWFTKEGLILAGLCKKE